MNSKHLSIFTFFILSFLLSACASNKRVPNPPVTGVYPALSQAANSIDKNLIKLSATEQAAYPPQDITETPIPESYDMSIPISVNWNGPAEKLVRKLANMVSYKFVVVGKKPTIPILVLLAVKRDTVGNILRNVGYQSGKRASVVVFPVSRTIELRYTNI
jgi:defect-in-organelle-trafficking protein DotD